MFKNRSISAILVVLILTTIVGGPFVSPAFAKGPNIVGKAGILIDAKSGQVVYDKNAKTKLPPASTTKILTVAVALQNGNLEDEVTVSKKASLEEGSSIYLLEGEVLKLEDMLWAIMLNSGNGSAVAVAEHIAGSVEAFVDMMNKQAKEWGALNSHFNNPNGLPDDKHYTTAYDLAMITKHAMEIPLFREMVGEKVKEIDREDPESLFRLINHNKLLWRYEGANGVKTGYTRAAGNCLVSSAKKGDQEFIAVVLGSSGNNVYTDSTALLDYGFKNFKTIKLTSKNSFVHEYLAQDAKGPVKAVTKIEKYLTIKSINNSKPEEQVNFLEGIKAPIKKGQELGNITYTIDGEVVAEVPLIAENSVERQIIVKRYPWIIPTAVIVFALGFVRSVNKRRRYYRRRRKRVRKITSYRGPIR